ncbi:MAG: SDR family oxidoreductase [Opitutales bacterium]|nr:SDR family oxidoreductase [Opitutales bacterium]
MAAKKIVLTGCTRGLGRALLEEWILDGHHLAGCGRNEKTVRELGNRFGAPHRFDVVDVSEAETVNRWASEVLREGLPDLLVNNAAVMHEPAPFWEIPREAIAQNFQVNLLGSIHVLQAFLPAFVQARRGMIVNLSSGAGRSGIPRISVYGSTKWAIEGLTKSIAAELPEGVGIIPLSPGMVDTDMLRACYGDQAAEHRPVQAWAKVAARFILGLTPAQSGQSISTP